MIILFFQMKFINNIFYFVIIKYREYIYNCYLFKKIWYNNLPKKIINFFIIIIIVNIYLLYLFLFDLNIKKYIIYFYLLINLMN